ncbi:MAG: radical SAM protein, partial [Fusobacterium varium]
VYPDKISDEFINMFDNKKLMPHLHISLQSCDDEVLKRMRRKYGSSLIEERLLKLKKKVKNMEYTADVIVGFPGETEEMFQNSYNLIEKIGFSGIHIFQYSDRENTIASSFTDKIDAKVKKERADRLEVLKSEMAKKERKKYIGKHLSVLLEEKINGYLYGYSENYLRVKIKDNGIEVNSIIDIKINSLEKEMLIAYE